MQNSALASMIKEKKTHFEGKKALKNTFPQQKNTTMKKSTQKTLLFLKTLAGRTELQISLGYSTQYVDLRMFCDIPSHCKQEP